MVIWRIFVTIFIVGIFVNVHEVEAFNLTAYIRVRAIMHEGMLNIFKIKRGCSIYRYMKDMKMSYSENPLILTEAERSVENLYLIITLSVFIFVYIVKLAFFACKYQ